ncbi:MAG: sugar phosphate isomerase/epimerase family protein [Ginsengibacter sp.]
MSTTRRNLIKNIALGTSAVIASPAISFAKNFDHKKKYKMKGNINHSVCRWTFNQLSVEELCKAVKDIGFNAIDLVGPADWPTLQKYGIFSSMCYTAGENSLTKGWNDPTYHEGLIKDFTEVIPLAAKAGYKNVICFSGNRNGMDDQTGLKNCAEGLKKILPLAEKNGIIIQMELLNSKVNHKDYMCDRTAWGVELCKSLNSENFKLLYDIYHMQIDEGDVIRTIQDNHQYIGHYHTGGVPGRHEIDETQELYYPAIMNAILATGFKDYVAQEFLPAKENKVESLREAVKICDV